jgi:hypothetical protein
MIKIKPNDYVQPTEIREEVVQAICDAFLCEQNCWNIYHPNDGGRCRNRCRQVIGHRSGEFYGFHFEPICSSDKGYVIRGVEMQQAFDDLIKAGYHMFRICECGWTGYRLSKTPFPLPYWKCAVEVFSFDERID